MRLKALIATAALAGAAVAVPLTAMPASAAPAFTPGHVCDLYITVSNVNLGAAGTISSDGNTCVPNSPLSGLLGIVNAGVTCGTTIPIYNPTNPTSILGGVKSVCYT